MSGEFEAIGRLARLLPAPDAGAVGIGDDAAVVGVPGGGQLLLAADSVVAGVHADLALTGLDDLGWKALAVNVSDVAAMAGRPLCCVVTVAGPPATDLDLLYRGIAEASRRWRCPVVGGDLANADALVVTVAIAGILDGPPILRRGARPGDFIWVTGALGLAAAGLRTLRQLGKQASGEAVDIHRRPQPSVECGLAARSAGATAMIDISDGLVSDLTHIAVSSGIGFALDDVPIGDGATLAEALTGGEDYVLAFTAPAIAPVKSEFRGLAGPVRIGVCVADLAQRTFAGSPLPEIGGWEHRWA